MTATPYYVIARERIGDRLHRMEYLSDDADRSWFKDWIGAERHSHPKTAETLRKRFAGNARRAGFRTFVVKVEVNR